MKPENKSMKSPEELESLRGSDAVIDFMLRKDIPLTRGAYIRLAFDQPESKLGAEELATIPPVFR